jgi:hypothetical protein
MQQSQLEDFAKPIFGITKFEGIIGRSLMGTGSQLLVALKRETFNFCKLYTTRDADHEEIQTLGASIEGLLLQCQMFSLLSHEEADTLIDRLHVLLEGGKK